MTQLLQNTIVTPQCFLLLSTLILGQVGFLRNNRHCYPTILVAYFGFLISIATALVLLVFMEHFKGGWVGSFITVGVEFGVLIYLELSRNKNDSTF